MAGLEPVVRHPRVEMMDVVKADVAGEPLQQPRQAEIRTAPQRRRHRRPRVVARPERSLEAMLQREQPHADDRGDDRGRQLHQQHVAQPQASNQGGKQQQQRQVGAMHRPSFVRPRSGRIERHPVKDEKHQGRQQQQRDDRMQHRPVDATRATLAARGTRPRSGRSNRCRCRSSGGRDRSSARGGRRAGVATCVRRQREQAAQPADPVVGAPRPKERAVAAVMLDDEDPDDEAGGHHRQRQRCPVAARRGWRTSGHRGRDTAGRSSPSGRR